MSTKPNTHDAEPSGSVGRAPKEKTREQLRREEDEERSHYAPFKWNENTASCLLQSMTGMKPAGINKYLTIDIIREKMCKKLKMNVPTGAIYNYLVTLWDMDVYDRFETSKYKIKKRNFELPEEYNEIIETLKEEMGISTLSSKDKSVNPKDSPETSNNASSSTVETTEFGIDKDKQKELFGVSESCSIGNSERPINPKYSCKGIICRGPFKAATADTTYLKNKTNMTEIEKAIVCELALQNVRTKYGKSFELTMPKVIIEKYQIEMGVKMRLQNINKIQSKNDNNKAEPRDRSNSKLITSKMLPDCSTDQSGGLQLLGKRTYSKMNK